MAATATRIQPLSRYPACSGSAVTLVRVLLRAKRPGILKRLRTVCWLCMPLKLQGANYRDVTRASAVCHLIVSRRSTDKFRTQCSHLRIAATDFRHCAESLLDSPVISHDLQRQTKE